MSEEDERNILPLEVLTAEQYAFNARPPNNPARRGENDCRVVANYKLPCREEDFRSARVRPITQADLARDNDGATWVIGTAIAASGPVDVTTLPVLQGPPHGIDPIGRPLSMFA